MVKVWLEYHKSRKTLAETVWLVDCGTTRPVLRPVDKLFVILETTLAPNKTHWKELYDIPEGTRLVRVRRSNRGNIDCTVFVIKKEMEGKVLPFC